MDELDKLLANIGNVAWAFYALSLMVLYKLSKGATAKSSNLLTLIVIVVFNIFMKGYEGIVLWYMATPPDFSPVVNFCWYMGFASFDFVAIRAIFKVHKKENVRIGRLGQYASFAFFTLATIQLLQYAEIIILNTDKNLDTLYRTGIPSINIATAIICTGVALAALCSSFFSKNRRNG
jgi:hypothetical protein